MRLINKLVVLMIVVKLTKSAPDPCSLELEESSCDQTEYEAYKECIQNESKNQNRKKRQAPCPLTNVESLIAIKENCQRANYDCRIKCGDDKTCESECPVCPLNVDELIATSANGTGDHRTIIVEGDKNSDKFQTINAAGNITTVIRLTNIINATSSDVPQTDGVDDGGDFGLGFNENGSCCYVVHPKTCTSTSIGRRCHHRREKVCGRQCTAKVIHAQERRRCNKSSGCHTKTSFVPQPKRPRCVHTRQWPYVSCGNVYSSNCDGCYDHYGSGFDKDDDKEKECQGCYDDAFDYGPLYRRGPVLRPYFYHVPPCYIMGTCYPYPLDCGYGCFDHELIDPAWGHHRRHQKNVDDYDDEEFDYEEDQIDVEKPNAANTNETDGNAGDWAIEIHKCKVVSENGTIEIRNCTSEDIDENPYASGPYDSDDYDVEEDDYLRSRRHLSHRKFHHSRVVYYSVPIVESYNYDDEDSEQYDYDEPPRRRKSRPRKSHQRKNSIIYDDDDDDGDVAIN